MRRIGLGEIEQTYRLAKDVYFNRIREDQAADELSSKFGMNRRSAAIYLSAFRHMASAKCYTQTINNEAVEYFLYEIRRDLGQKIAASALKSVDLHLEYYRSVQKSEMPELSVISDRFRRHLVSEDSQTTFEEEVQKSLALPIAERKLLLPISGTKPDRVQVTTTAFQRNPHVVAEVLSRSNGLCEACGSDAPFLKRTDGRPYLEVHHRQTLADDGDDTVENAVALCPNCHRKCHYG